MHRIVLLGSLLGSLPNTALIGDWQARVSLLHDILVATWGLNALNWVLLGRAMFWLGIRPRTQIGLLGILFGPFLHGDLPHLFGNTLGFIVLGWFVLLRGSPVFTLVSVVTALASGFGVWLFGRSRVYYQSENRIYPVNMVHIGASGVIFGYLGFLLFASVFDRNPLSLILSLTVGVFYWNLLPGIFPKQIGISWEAHFFGFLGGILAAWWLPAIGPLLS